jgi:hypothetical protein
MVPAERIPRALQLLASTLDANHDVRRAAEAALQQQSTQHGHGVVLCSIALSPAAPAELQQLAAVLLKQYIKAHWIEGERRYEPPTATDEEKRFIKDALPAGLSQANSKVRTAVALAIATIAKWDYPEQWPGLLEHLVACIKSGHDTNLGEAAAAALAARRLAAELVARGPAGALVRCSLQGTDSPRAALLPQSSAR